MAANTSITITFVTPDDQFDDDGNVVQSISVELDSVKNGGVSQFEFGMAAYFKTYRVPANLPIQLDQSDGTLAAFSYSGTDTIKNEQMMFAMTDSASPSKPISPGSFSYTWHGKPPAPSATATENGGQVKLNKISLGFIKASFSANFDGHYLTLPPQEFSPYPVIIYISTVE